MPKVSVIIPTYNCARYLPAAIESVLRQTYRDFEVIVVDDGSTDDTEAVASRYAGQIQFIRQPNRGAGAARNRAVEAASGEFLGFLDADDEWLPEKLELQVGRFADPRVDLVYGDLRTIYDDGRAELPSFLAVQPQACEGEIFAALLAKPFIALSTVLARKRAILAVGGFDESLLRAQDYDLFFRLCRQGHAAVVRAVVVLRRERAGNNSSDLEGMSYYSVQLFRNALRLARTTEERRLGRRRLSQYQADRAGLLLKRGRRGLACREFLLCLARIPGDKRAWRGLAASLAWPALHRWAQARRRRGTAREFSKGQRGPVKR